MLKAHFVLKFLPVFLLVSCGGSNSSELNSEHRGADRCSNLVGSCDYYSCVEQERLSCGSSGYPLGYGLNYCQKLSAVDFPAADSELASRVFPADGNIWKAHVRECLQIEMEQFFRENADPSCQELRTFAFDSHPRCYTGKVSYCDLNVPSIVKVGLTIAPKDLVSVESQKQVRETAGICVEQIDSKLQMEEDFLVRLQLRKYKLLWKALALSPAGLTEWLGRFIETGDENIP